MGEEIEAKVLSIDSEERKISLGYKQLEPDPWETIEQTYVPGTVYKGIVRNLTNFGAFIELEEGIEGLIHVSELSKEKIDSPKDFAEVGAELEAGVLQVDTVDRKIALSIKNLDVQKEKAQVSEFMGAQKTATSNLGDLLQGAVGRKSEE